MSTFDTYLDTRSPEDAGARTADLYDWQASVATADGLAAVAISAKSPELDLQPRTIVCEHHEDYGVYHSATDIELVSVKHRELSSGAWTWSELFSRGGIPHLFGRWRALGSKFRCRLVTNAGLDPAEARRLDALCTYLREPVGDPPQGDIDLVSLCATEFLHRRTDSALGEDWNIALSPSKRKQRIPSDLYEACKEFLSKLTLDCGRPNRELMQDAAPSRYAAPALKALGYSESLASAAWAASLDLFRIRMRSKGITELGGLNPIVEIFLGENSQT